MNSLKTEIIEKSKELGFNLIGFAPHQLLETEIENLNNWLSKSYHAGMTYMERNIDKRRDIRNIIHSCESVISLGMNYKVNGEFDDTEDGGKVSRYAWGRDYHYIIWEKLNHLIEFIKLQDQNIDAVSYVDTGPVMDKAWAVKSGLGWMGKHSNIINREFGSWFFIANIFTNHNFKEYDHEVKDYCGSCTACIEACPTDAIVKDNVIDSNKCISYLTIENKNEISEKFVGKFENWIFGCDICQDVCPWNKKFSIDSMVEDFYIFNNKYLKFSDIEEFSNKEFKERFIESPISRAKLKGLKRNANFLKKGESK